LGRLMVPGMRLPRRPESRPKMALRLASAVPLAAAFGADIQAEQYRQGEASPSAERQRHPQRHYYPDMPKAGERLAGTTEQRIMVHAGQSDALAAFAGQRIVA